MTRKKDLSFAEARARLLEILHEVETDGGDVDRLASRLKEAAELHRFCNERLAAARAQVATVVADLAAAEQDPQGAGSSADARGDADDDDADEDEDAEEEASDAEEDDAGDADEAPRGRPGRLPF